MKSLDQDCADTTGSWTGGEDCEAGVVWVRLGSIGVVGECFGVETREARSGVVPSEPCKGGRGGDGVLGGASICGSGTFPADWEVNTSKSNTSGS